MVHPFALIVRRRRGWDQLLLQEAEGCLRFPTTVPGDLDLAGGAERLAPGVFLCRCRTDSPSIIDRVDPRRVWAALPEFQPRGGFDAVNPAESVPAEASVFGVPICAQSQGIVRCLGLAERLCSPDVVGYHGTSREALEAILADGRLRETQVGMLGRGVYAALFDKAAHRYALRDTEYRPRADGGAVVRLYFGGAVRELPDATHACACRTCRAGLDWFRRRCVDHTGEWRRMGFRGARLRPERRPDSDPIRRPLHVVKNEEWVLDGDFVRVMDFVNVRGTATGRYNPFLRQTGLSVVV